jgi:ferredoxin
MKGHGFLEKRLAAYDQWLAEGRLKNTARVIPVERALSVVPTALVADQALDVLRQSRVFALADCVCRTTFKHCDRPLEVCFYLDEAAEKKLAKGEARLVSLAEAKAVLDLAAEAGLVPMTLFVPHQMPLALCNCCSCCCHDLQFHHLYGRRELIAGADWVAEDDPELCVQCGTCVQRCPFQARRLEGEALLYSPQDCRGCGLCVTTCPSGAIRLKPLAGTAGATRAEVRD